MPKHRGGGRKHKTGKVTPSTQIKFMGAGTPVGADAPTSLTPPLPSGAQAEDLILLFYADRGSVTPTRTKPGDYTSIESSAGNGVFVGVAYKIHSGSESDPTVNYTAFVAGNDAVAQTAIVRFVNQTTPIEVEGTVAFGSGTPNIGPITGITQSENGAGVVVCGSQRGNSVSQTLLPYTSEKIVWELIGSFNSIAGSDIAAHWQFGRLGLAQTIADKTIITNEASDVSWRGVMFSIKPQNYIPETPAYELTVTKSGIGQGEVRGLGIDTVEGDFSEVLTKDQDVTLNAITDSGNEFVEWTGDVTGTETSTTIFMTNNKNVNAEFTGPVSPVAPAPPNEPTPEFDAKYVSTTGNDSNPGTLTSPYLTLEKLYTELAPNKQGVLRAGTYGQLGTDLILNKPIKLISYPGERGSILSRFFLHDTAQGTFVQALRFNFIKNRASDFHVLDCRITQYPTPAEQGFLQTKDAAPPEDVLVEWCRIDNCGDPSGVPVAKEHGMYISSAIRLTVRYCWIHDNGWRGIQVYPNCDDAEIYGNVFYRNNYGIVINGSGTINVSERNNVHNNIFSSPRLTNNVYAGTEYTGTPLSGANRSDVKNNISWNGIIKPSNALYDEYGNQTLNPQLVDPANGDLTVPLSSQAWSLYVGPEKLSVWQMADYP